MFIPRKKKIEIERSLFNNDKTMKVWGLKNAKIAGKRIISSPEPKAHGELIVYRSIRRPSVRKHFQTSISPQTSGPIVSQLIYLRLTVINFSSMVIRFFFCYQSLI